MARYSYIAIYSYVFKYSYSRFPSPAEVADADVVWGSGALPMLALDAAGFVAVLPSVPLKARITLTIV